MGPPVSRWTLALNRGVVDALGNSGPDVIGLQTAFVRRSLDGLAGAVDRPFDSAYTPLISGRAQCDLSSDIEINVVKNRPIAGLFLWLTRRTNPPVRD